jgi:predicted transcriptional regulator
MATITLTDDKLNEIIETAAHKAAEDTVFEILRNKDALSNLAEIMEDMALGKLMEEERTGEFVDTDEFLKELDRKIAG